MKDENGYSLKDYRQVCEDLGFEISYGGLEVDAPSQFTDSGGHAFLYGSWRDLFERQVADQKWPCSEDCDDGKQYQYVGDQCEIVTCPTCQGKGELYGSDLLELVAEK